MHKQRYNKLITYRDRKYVIDFILKDLKEKGDETLPEFLRDLTFSYFLSEKLKKEKGNENTN